MLYMHVELNFYFILLFFELTTNWEEKSFFYICEICIRNNHCFSFISECFFIQRDIDSFIEATGIWCECTVHASEPKFKFKWPSVQNARFEIINFINSLSAIIIVICKDDHSIKIWAQYKNLTCLVRNYGWIQTYKKWVSRSNFKKKNVNHFFLSTDSIIKIHVTSIFMCKIKTLRIFFYAHLPKRYFPAFIINHLQNFHI